MHCCFIPVISTPQTQFGCRTDEDQSICFCFVIRQNCRMELKVNVQSWKFDLTLLGPPCNFRLRCRRYADPPLNLKSMLQTLSKHRRVSADGASERQRCGLEVAIFLGPFLASLFRAIQTEFSKTLFILFYRQKMLYNFR